jgi:hypothetical protein
LRQQRPAAGIRVTLCGSSVRRRSAAVCRDSVSVRDVGPPNRAHHSIGPHRRGRSTGNGPSRSATFWIEMDPRSYARAVPAPPPPTRQGEARAASWGAGRAFPFRVRAGFHPCGDALARRNSTLASAPGVSNVPCESISLLSGETSRR